MNRVPFGADLYLTRLGFGAARLAGGRAPARRLLDAAFEAGVRHFDVAPAYGFGTAEDALGTAMAKRRPEVTITTKVGLPRPTGAASLSRLRAVARPLLGFAPALRERLGRTAYVASMGRARFEVDWLKRSLGESLRRLRTDHVDIVLLHELDRSRTTDELHRFLEDVVKGGQARAYGVGSVRAEAEAIARSDPTLAQIVQTNWAAWDDPLVLPDGVRRVTHGSMRVLGALQGWLQADKERFDRVSASVNRDLKRPGALADLLLAAALAESPSGVVLVASSRIDRVRRHAEIAGDKAALQAGRRLTAALGAERTRDRGVRP